MKVIDLKENQRFLKQYVSLRNKYRDLLLTKKVTIEETKEWLKKAPVEIRCLLEGNELLGVVILYLNKKNEVTVFVKRPNKGLGKKLLLIIDKIARAKKIARLWAWVLTTNIPAQRLFEGCGYKKERLSKRKFKNIIFDGYIFYKIIKN
jgi:RimJ/RimL family protein N-acetyltransferase